MANHVNALGRIGGTKNIEALETAKEKFSKVGIKEIPHIMQVHRAWTLMLIEREIIKKELGCKILLSLDKLEANGLEYLINTYALEFDKSVLQLERYMTEQVGAHAGDILIGRTLPPPHYRMELRDTILDTIDSIQRLKKVLLKQAEEHKTTVMPGYTHLQHAQPQTYGHYLLSFYDALERASIQLERAYDSTNMCDLGGGALAGVSFDIDRVTPAHDLGFGGIVENSNDCMAATDFVVDVLSALLNTSIPLSRVANDFDIWSTYEFNMVEIADSIAHTSSMMPQKKNPCVFEDSRAFVGKIIAKLTDITIQSHNTQYGDVVEIMKLCQSTSELLRGCPHVIDDFTLAVDTLIIKKDVMLKAAFNGFSTVTELAALLYRKSELPLRHAHLIVAELVRTTINSGDTLAQIKAETICNIAKKTSGRKIILSQAEVENALNPVSFVELHDSQGGVAPREVARMLKKRYKTLKQFEIRQIERRQQLHNSAEALLVKCRNITNNIKL